MNRHDDLAFFRGMWSAFPLAIILWLLIAIGFVSYARAEPAIISLGLDNGGSIVTYMARADEIRKSGAMVRIDAPCFSACTVLPPYSEPERICVGRYGALGFHVIKASEPGMSKILMGVYPEAIRAWIAVHGGLSERHLWMSAYDLVAAGFKPCTSN
jgi:hypothetical protein